MGAYLKEIMNRDNLSVYPSNQVQLGSPAIMDDNYMLKRWIWMYFFLLIFEGALRKWVLPGLSSPLLLIREPVAIWLVYSAWKRNLLPSTVYLTGIVIIGIVGIYLALFNGHGNLWVALYGGRVLLVHFPLMFVIGRIFTREDVIRMGKVTLLISIPMILLVAMQFHSPQSAWVNRGIGGDIKGGGFSGTADFFRPPATFSFITGTTEFFGLQAAFVFYFWLNPQKINFLLLIAASVAMSAAIPFSISRTLFFEIVLTLIFTLIAILRKPEYIGKVIVSIVASLIVLVFLSHTSLFKTAIGAFTDRFTSADDAEGGLKGVLGDRFLGGLLSAIVNSSNQPFFGNGIGMGTNVGSMLLTGTKTFLISEGEWGREVGELGPIVGLLVILLRVGLCLKLTLASYAKMIKGDLLPWLLLSFGLVILAQGGWAQPTSLGFFVIIGGLLIASLQSEDSTSEVTELN